MFAAADAVAMAFIMSWVGHHGKYGSRFMCNMPGCGKPGTGHYYPVMLKPQGYNKQGCDHSDIPINNLPKASPEKYQRHLQFVISS
jgi:hypothetical protein